MKKKDNQAHFSKAEILKSKRYRHKIDLVNALLDDKRVYTFREVDKMIDRFLRKKVI